MFGNNRDGSLGVAGHANEGPPIVASAPQVRYPPALDTCTIIIRQESRQDKTHICAYLEHGDSGRHVIELKATVLARNIW